MQLYLEELPRQFKSMKKQFAPISIEHEMIPFRPIDVTIEEGTQKWGLVDNILVRNHQTDEQIQFRMSIVDVPYKSSTGYLIKGVHRQLVNLYEMCKGWHFELGEDNKSKKNNDPLSRRSVKFNPDTSLVQNVNYYSFGVKEDIITINKGNKSVPISIFLRALTGLSYSSILQEIGATNKYLINTFSLPEYSRVECVNKANALFAKSGKSIGDVTQYEEKRAADIQDMSKIISFRNKFIGEGAMIGNGAERAMELFNFRIIKNCFLARPVTVGDKTWAAGTKLIPELLMELDYSPVDILYCKTADSNKIFIFKKYEIYNFRGLNRGATDTLEQLRMAESRNELEYTLSTGEKITRLSAPLFNTVDIIMNILNLYVNYLNGFSINSNIYDMTNQSVIPIEQEIYNTVMERLSIINQKVAELSEEENNVFTVRNLPSKLMPFDTDTLIDKYAKKKGKTSPLANMENSLGSIAQNSIIVKDVAHSQGAMVTVQDSTICRLDSFDAPENKNVGLLHNKTMLARIRSDSQLEAPFVQVVNGKIISDIVWLSAAAEKDQYIGEWNEDFSGEVTTARYNGVMMKVHPSKLNYLEASCYQHASAARALSPFMECMAGKRATMSSSQAKQAIAIVGAERPIINSGAESIVSTIDDENKPFITARDLIQEHCWTTNKDFDSIKDVTLRYKSFEDHGADRIHQLSYIIDGVSFEISKQLPSYQPTLQKTIYGFSLYSENGLEFQGDDIVFHSLTYDVKKYKRNDSIKEGALKFDPSVYDSGLALGRNLHVGYMTYEGVTIDDAMLLNDRLVTEDHLSSVFVHQEEYEIERLDEKTEFFGFLGGKIVEGYRSDGLPHVGTYLAPGSTIINKFIIKINDDGTTDSDSVGYTTNIDLPPTIGGQVVSSTMIGGTRAVVTIVSLSKVEEGDKMAGRYGNKGVIAKIVPNYMMPYDPATGKAFDIILNPLGIPSRINVSQVLEVTYAACNKQEGAIAVVTPFQQGFINKIKEDAERLGIKPINPINPKTGLRTEYGVHVGEIYMYKLIHKVSGKLHSIGVTTEVDTTFQQPIGTGKSKAKGQAFGELESWCTMSAECFEFLEEVQTLLSEDFESRRAALKQIADQAGPVDLDSSSFKNTNGKHLTMFYKGSGIKVLQDAENSSIVQFAPMTDTDIMGLNPMNPVTISDIKNSLRSPRIFKDGKYSKEDVWSWMPLGGEILSPFWVERGKIFKCIVLNHLVNNRWQFDVLKQIDINKIIDGNLWIVEDDIVTPSRWYLSDTAEDGSITGMPALVNLFRKFDLSISEQFYEKAVSKDPTDVDSATILATIQELKEKNGLKDYIISSFPVVPIRYRPAPTHASKQQDFDYYYTAIARSALSYQQSHNFKDLAMVYSYIQLFLGIAGDDKKKALLSDKDDYVDLKKFATNKQASGRIREMMAKKRVHRSGRSVIVPFSDTSIPPTHIGIPYFIAANIYEADLTTLVVKKWPTLFPDDTDERTRNKLAVSIIKNAIIGNEAMLAKISGEKSGKVCRTIKRMMKEFLEEQVVVFGRQPSLHKFSMRAFKVVLVEGKAIQVHPLVCLGFNADFDGDTGYIIAPFTIKSVQEVWKTLSVVNGIVNPGTGGIIIEPSQDILLGLYYATAFEKNSLRPVNVNPLPYNKLTTLLADLHLGIILPSQWVTLRHKNSWYFSTAGRIAFNSLLPGGFTNQKYKDKYKFGIAGDFKDLRYDAVVSGRVSDKSLYVSISTIFKELFDEYCTTEPDREVLISYYQAISQFGFEWSERSGISFNIGDLNESPMIADFLQSAERVSAEIDKKYAMGLMTAEDRRKAVMSIYAEVRSDDFLKKYLSSFDRTNNIFMMFDSKAKGSEDQIMQTCGMLGVLQKTKDETLEVPITANYSQGLSSFDLFQTSYAARLGLLSTIMETQKPGELTRTLVYAFAGLHVTEDHCRDDNGDLRIRYDRQSNDFMFMDNPDYDGTENLQKTIRVREDDLIGAEIQDEEVLKYDRVCGDTGKVTKELLKELLHSGLPWFDTSKGRVHFDVKLPDFWKKLLLYRTLEDPSYDYRINRKYISEGTLAQIEKERPRFLSTKLIINCLSSDGICADSYGLRYDPVEPVKVGAFIGTEAAQSIGEPSAQLTMNLANKGGKAGESIGDGISIMMSAIKDGSIKIENYGFYSPANGYISIDKYNLILHEEGGAVLSLNIAKHADKLLVRNGSYVTVGQPLTTGMLHPINSFAFTALTTADGFTYPIEKLRKKSSIINPSAELVAKIRYEIAAFYNFVYSESRIKILGRHFEIAAYMQTSHGVVLRSNNPDFKVGRQYPVGALVNSGVDFCLSFQNASKAIARNAGPILASCYQDSYNVISAAVWSGKSRERSPLSAILTGSPATQKGLSINNLTDEVDLNALKYIKRSDSSTSQGSISTTVFDTTIEELPMMETIETIENAEDMENLWGHLDDNDMAAELEEVMADLFGDSSEDSDRSLNNASLMDKF